jgi:hypothetical protein
MDGRELVFWLFLWIALGLIAACLFGAAAWTMRRDRVRGQLAEHAADPATKNLEEDLLG